jgi:F-type H+-transporting ATPase subunit b
MNINATLLGQTITFIVFVWFCMKFIWPPLMGVLETRRQTIADGLAAGEKGRHELELAEKHAVDIVKKSKHDATDVIAAADRRAAEIADQAKDVAASEAKRIVEAARAEIDQELNRVREQLRESVSKLAIAGASRILEREVDAKTHAQLLESVIRQL